MRSIICLIIFHTVFGKHFLVELETNPKENELSSDEDEYSYSAEDEYIPFDDFSSEEDGNMTKTEEGKDYARNHAPRPHAPYARGTHCGGDNSLIILH